MILQKRKSAMVSTELAVGIALAAVALFVALGLFGDNLSAMISSSKIGNLINPNDTKTDYQKFERDYSNSQINVQIMGEQGLEMLRRKANNKAIELIEESLDGNNPNANSIAYLSAAIKAISGEPHICAYMKKDSEQHCDKLDGYDYKTSVSGSALIINSNSKNINLKLNSVVASVINGLSIPLDANGYSKFTTQQKYDFIKNLTDKLLAYLRPDAILIQTTKTFTSSKNYTPREMSADLTILTSNLQAALNKAYNSRYSEDCEWYDFFDWFCEDDYDGDPDITDGDKQAVDLWSRDLMSSLAKTSSTDKTQIINAYVQSLTKTYNTGTRAKTALSVLDDDYDIYHDGHKLSCEILKDGLSKIADNAGVTISMPVCIPGST